VESWGLNYGTDWPSWAGLITRGVQYVEVFEDNDEDRRFREFYDLTRDPWQLTNVLRDGNPDNDAPAELEILSTRLPRDRSCRGTSCP
jgi:hypothetical protein